MAIVFLFIGIAAVAVGVRGQAANAGKLLASEFTGPNSFIQWLAAIVILGVIGFYRPVRPASNAMLGLVILAMFLSKGTGFFNRINQALTSAQPAAKPPSSVVGSGAVGAPNSSGNFGPETPAGSGIAPPVTPNAMLPFQGPNDPFSIGIGEIENSIGLGPGSPFGQFVGGLPSLPEF